MNSAAFSRSLDELNSLISNSSTRQNEIESKMSQVIQNWKVFQAEYSRIVDELEVVKKESLKNNKIVQLKLASPQPYNHTPETLYERRQFVKRDANSELPELEALQERNTRLTLLNARSGSVSSTSSQSPSPPSSGYGSPPVFLTPTTPNSRFLNPENGGSSIRQRGSETKLALFQNFTNQYTLQTITIVELSLMEIEPQLMFGSLRQHADTLTTIKFDRVIFKGELNQRINMPKLEEFYCYQCTNWLHKCENSNISRDGFKSLLFFGNWEICDVLSLPLRRIELVVDGWTQFKLNHESGELVSKLSFTSEILSKLGNRDTSFKLKKLGLQQTKLDLSIHEDFPSTVTYLNFQSIITTNLTVVEILRACTNLRELRFKNYIDTNGIYLKDIPTQNLKFLCLGLCTYTLSIKYSPGITFPALETLVFPTNIMDPKILENLSSIFKCKDAVVYLCTSNICNLYKTGYFILSQLLEMEDICSIRMSNFRRIQTERLPLELFERMEEFLNSTGLTENTACNGINFILEKKTTNLGKVKWVGRRTGQEELQVLEFQLRDGHKFSCWESYLKRY